MIIRRKLVRVINSIFLFVLIFALYDENVTANPSNSIYKEITISAAGDCTLGIDEYFNYQTSLPAKYQSVGDPSYFLGGVVSIFDNDDLTIVNMEGTLSDRGYRMDKTYAFKGKPEYTNILTEGSVEAVTLANNHSYDYGEESYQDTIHYLNEAGIVNFGNDRYSIETINGIKVGLIGIYELPYGIKCKDDMVTLINKVKEEGADIIIASFHWGIERDYYPGSVQVELAKTAIDYGVDLVLGHHPHVLQGIERYKGKYIVYSLGNFCFGGNSNPSDKDTMIFVQTFKFLNNKLITDDTPDGVMVDSTWNIKNDSGGLFDSLEHDNCQVVPCSLSSVDYANDYRPTILKDYRADKVLDKIDTLSQPLNRN